MDSCAVQTCGVLRHGFPAIGSGRGHRSAAPLRESRTATKDSLLHPFHVRAAIPLRYYIPRAGDPAVTYSWPDTPEGSRCAGALHPPTLT